ncbi:hypothetical protein [Bartonella quintana]|uniref:Uncharacterized protein n=2 Tax=Bartonella quintana TaxID=803 RepID=W3TWX3_BARQI|nr:hypothetical protein [Bartonella quintana]ETS11033.1 hypothetical protein Q651_01356 [Bartonella quintana BQ2-D70]ETS13031.1 hypothetical protein Q650_01322 [Bartonella quintana JK 73rel]ETS15104.1 hypothetical protein Q649_01323 [Bartonella quintana JK 73]ETS16574.1 hypothetical protein Q648_01304 [Bartonella quintana JK 12]ETS17365.1 hypothetical protein Q647_01318 [Bartonella quintana JK 7]
MKISSGNSSPIATAIQANKSQVTLKDVTINKTETSIVTQSDSQVIISGGSFDGKMFSLNSSTITLNNKITVTSSNGDRLHPDGLNSTITMTGGSVIEETTCIVSRKQRTD